MTATTNPTRLIKSIIDLPPPEPPRPPIPMPSDLDATGCRAQL
jgi:hypothetical protein